MRARVAMAAAALSTLTALSVLGGAGTATAAEPRVEAQSARLVDDHHVDVEIDYSCEPGIGPDPKRIGVYVDQSAAGAMFGSADVVCDGTERTVTVSTEAEDADCPPGEPAPDCFVPFTKDEPVHVSASLSAGGSTKAHDDRRIRLG